MHGSCSTVDPSCTNLSQQCIPWRWPGGDPAVTGYPDSLWALASNSALHGVFVKQLMLKRLKHVEIWHNQLLQSDPKHHELLQHHCGLAMRFQLKLVEVTLSLSRSRKARACHWLPEIKTAALHSVGHRHASVTTTPCVHSEAAIDCWLQKLRPGSPCLDGAWGFLF